MSFDVFRVIIPILLITFVVHRAFYTRKVQHLAASVRRQPKLGIVSLAANVAAIPALLGTLLFVFYPTAVSWAEISLPLWLRCVGVGVGLSGIGLLHWSQQTIGQNWSDAPKLIDGQELIVSGPYRWIRHPIYSAFLLFFGSVLITSANWLLGGSWFLMTSLEIAARIKAEEAMMLDHFGERYRAYMQRTGRVLPRVIRKRESGSPSRD